MLIAVVKGLKAGSSHRYSGSLGFVLCRGTFCVIVLLVRGRLVVSVLVSHKKINVNLELIASELPVVIASIPCLLCRVGGEW